MTVHNWALTFRSEEVRHNLKEDCKLQICLWEPCDSLLTCCVRKHLVCVYVYTVAYPKNVKTFTVLWRLGHVCLMYPTQTCCFIRYP